MLNRRRLVFILAASAFATVLSAADPDTKIDSGLINTITDSDSGTAAFFVMFGDRAPLTTASSITDWKPAENSWSIRCKPRPAAARTAS